MDGNQLRKDTLTNTWVINGKRMGKNLDYKSLACPFCPGGNSDYEKEICQYPKNGPWLVKVVPDKYPLLQIEGDLYRKAEGIYDKMMGIGAHEIIIESPNHGDRLSTLSLEHMEIVIKTWQERISDLKKDERFRYILLFRNEGEIVGVKHPHSQIVATPFVSRRLNEELREMKNYFSLKERCLICDIVNQEIKNEVRLIDENQYFIAAAPFASRFPYETWILPKNHCHAFEQDTEEENIKEFALMIRNILKKLETILDEKAYTLCLHTAPNELSAAFKEEQWKTLKQDFHWHLEIMPKTSKTSGFERAAGIYTNPVSPEEAAKTLREA